MEPDLCTFALIGRPVPYRIVFGYEHDVLIEPESSTVVQSGIANYSPLQPVITSRLSSYRALLLLGPLLRHPTPTEPCSEHPLPSDVLDLSR